MREMLTMLNKWLMNIRSCYARAFEQKVNFRINNTQISDINGSRVFFCCFALRFFFFIYFAKSIVLSVGELHGSESLCSFLYSNL